MTSAEQQPLLGELLDTAIHAHESDIEIATNHGKYDDEDAEVLDFDPNGDVDDPRQWPTTFKWAMVLLLAGMAFTVTFTCISVVPIANRIIVDLDQNKSQVHSASSALLVTIWELGEAAGPLLIAPLSEVFGRYPVMTVCNILFIGSTLMGAFSPSTSILIITRALTGATVASGVLNPAIIGDMFESDHRGSAMSLLMLAPLVGGAIGPAISGAITEALGWRRVLLIAAGLASIFEIIFLLSFRETYKMTILTRRAKKLRKYGWDVRPQEKSNVRQNAKQLLWAITRPFGVLFGSAVLMLMSLFGSIAFSYYYVISISLPDILSDVYHFSPSQIGGAFLAFSVGSFISVVLCNMFLDRIYVQLRGSTKANGKPEHRLPLAIIGAFTLPIAVTAYGWVAQLHLPVAFLLLAVGLVGFTLLLVIIPLAAYVVDAYKLFAASAMTGVIVTRCLMSTFLPLTVEPLVNHMGYGWGFTVLGAASLACAPVPLLVFWYGEGWRQSCVFTCDEEPLLAGGS